MSRSPKPPQHVPFKSIYRENFEVVTERHGHVSLYPHTEQLPLLLRALNLEFYGALPDRISRVDHRGDGFHKLVLHNSAMMYCQEINRTRTDRLRLFDLPDKDLVSKISIVQQITEDHPRGAAHRFRFYAGADFFPEIRLSGRRLVFADHVLQRFSLRVPNNIGEDLRNFLEIFYGHALISMPCGPSRAFIVAYQGSILAFPFHEETPGEYFITTCLTVNEINKLLPELPPCSYNFHYAPDFTMPSKRHWLPPLRMIELYKCWSEKKTLHYEPAKESKFKWDHKFGLLMRDITAKGGYGPGSKVCFQDHVPGPHIAQHTPDQTDAMYDELECCKNGDSKVDWEAAFAVRDKILRGPRAPDESGSREP